MPLYWQNTDMSSAWNSTVNWWEDAAATIPHLNTPGLGDDCHLATGELGAPVIDGVIAVDLGAGVCDIPGVTLNAVNLITGGTWSGANLVNNGFLTGGTFTGSGLVNNNTISGGTFSGDNLHNVVTTGSISGGSFSNAHLVNDGTINDASLSGVTNFDAAAGTVNYSTGGTSTAFTCANLTNNGTINTGAAAPVTGGDILLTGIAGTCLGGAQL